MFTQILQKIVDAVYSTFFYKDEEALERIRIAREIQTVMDEKQKEWNYSNEQMTEFLERFNSDPEVKNFLKRSGNELQMINEREKL